MEVRGPTLPDLVALDVGSRKVGTSADIYFAYLTLLAIIEEPHFLGLKPRFLGAVGTHKDKD